MGGTLLHSAPEILALSQSHMQGFLSYATRSLMALQQTAAQELGRSSMRSGRFALITLIRASREHVQHTTNGST